MHLPQRKRNRKYGFDYCDQWSYFVAIITQSKICYFGKIMKIVWFYLAYEIWYMIAGFKSLIYTLI